MGREKKVGDSKPTPERKGKLEGTSMPDARTLRLSFVRLIRAEVIRVPTTDLEEKLRA